MKKSLTLTVMCLAALTASAQEKADIEVSYNYRHFHRSGKEQNHQLTLLANATESKFFSPETEFVDSLEYTPEGREIYNQMKMAAFTSGDLKSVPSRKIPMYIFKSKAKGETEVYDGQIAMMFTYTEPYEAQTWEIADSTRNILDYDCGMATCSYRGREWTAWFAVDIPIQDGPWKLSGLPGLILEASESTGQHHFTATGIQASRRAMTPVAGRDHYEKADRITMLKALRKFEENPEAGLGAALGIKLSVQGGIKVDKSLDFLETDYR
jgi:GLPGLI family protein